MSQEAAKEETDGWALFFDVDGFLAGMGLADRHGSVPARLKDVLSSLCLRLDGALALVSTRRIADLDRLFDPYRFCAAGVHGCETRAATGFLLASPKIEPHSFDVARWILVRLVARHPELELEDKRFGLAVHFSRAPRLHVLVRTVMKSVADVLGQGFTMQVARSSCEVRPSAWTKATAIAELMKHRPFMGRTPVLMGDALSDEDAFAYVNGCQGVTVRVGMDAATVARYSFAHVTEATEWLATIPPVTLPAPARSGVRVRGRDRTGL